MDTWNAGSGETTLQDVMTQIENVKAKVEGVTISGGEPLDQAEALEAILRVVRQVLSVDVLLFTGYPWEQLPEFVRSSGLVDAVVTDPYQADVLQNLALRGSDNQRLHLLTQLGRDRFACFDRERSAADDHLDIGFDEEGTAWMAGIPRRGDLEKLLGLLRSQGHHATGVHDRRIAE